MNVRIAIIAGRIMACTSVLYAQDDPQNGPYLFDAIIPPIPVIYEGAESTHGAIFLMPVDQSFSAWEEVPSHAVGIEHPGVGNEYPLLILSQEEAMVFSDGEWEIPASIDTAVSETIFLDPAAISGLGYWLEESVRQANETAAGVGQSNRVQVLFIEPLNAHASDVSDDILMPEAGYRIVHAQPAWYEWINPRLFLTQWAGFWVNGTSATPVVLVLVTF
jgi:hypothetical protein